MDMGQADIEVTFISSHHDVNVARHVRLSFGHILKSIPQSEGVLRLMEVMSSLILDYHFAISQYCGGSHLETRPITPDNHLLAETALPIKTSP